MAVLLVIAGLVVVAGAAFLVLRQARRIRSVDQRARADAIEPRSTFPTITVAPARHLQTFLISDTFRVPWADLYPSGLVGQLGVTEREIVLVDSAYQVLFHIPLSRVFEAAIVGSFEGHQSDELNSLVKVAWRRGGERIVSLFVVEGRRVAAERIRREVHLRAALGERPAFPQST